MYKIECVLKNGAEVTIAVASTLEEADSLLSELEMNMLDPTSTRIVFRNGYRMVAVKDISAVWVEDGEDIEERD